MSEVSVIVPVYNAEPYLRRCVDSILGQTFKDFELILVDDGSTDLGGCICDEYALKDSRVKAIHKENGGISSARNMGLDNSCGSWIMFCDDDDSVKPNWIEVLINGAKYNQDRLVMCQYAEVSIDGKERIQEINGLENITLLEKKDYYMVYKSKYAGFVWNRIFNADIIRKSKIYFDETVKMYEDILFCCEYLKNVNYKMLYIPICGYRFIDNNGQSKSRVYYSREYEEYNECKRYYFIRKQIMDEEQIKEYCNNEFWKYYNLCIIDMYEKSDATKDEKYKCINEILKDDAFRDALREADDITCGKKLRFILGLKNARMLILYHYGMIYLGKIKNRLV
jgi:glycosyltransferase involved in cell wall biosynthesis